MAPSRLPLVMTIALVALLIAAAACGVSSTSVPTASPSAASSPQASAASPTGNQSTAPSADASAAAIVLPDGFPVMPGAVADDPPRHADAAASWQTQAIGPDVYDWYVENLPLAGFPIDGLYPGGTAAVILFSTPDGDALQVAITASGAGTAFEVAPAVR
ncbi:MAG TPA: hypothetical protein VF013_04290 [Candidatus Limnocylindria bacterium]